MDPNRKKNYKKAPSAEDARGRRTKITTQLRREKKEEQLQKRRRYCEPVDSHMKKYNPEWYKSYKVKLENNEDVSQDDYNTWLTELKELSRQCKGLIPDSNNLNVCEKDIGDLSDILYQLNLDPGQQLVGKKGGSKQTGGAVTPALLTKLNGWIFNNRGIISDCAKYFLEKIYGAVAEATLHQDSHTFQFLITVISYLNQDVPLPGEAMVKTYIQKILFQKIQAVSDLQTNISKAVSDLQTNISNLSLRDLAYYILLGINLFQYVDPAKGVVLGAIDTISDFSDPLIQFIQTKEFLNLLYNISQSGFLTAGLFVNTSFSLLSRDKQVEIKNIYTLFDHNIARLIAEYIKNGYTTIDEKLAGLITSKYQLILAPFDEHLHETFIQQKMANALEIAKITNKIQIAKDDINDASLEKNHEETIMELEQQLTNLTNELKAILPQRQGLGGKRGKSTRRKIGSRKNKRVQKKKSTKKR